MTDKISVDQWKEIHSAIHESNKGLYSIDDLERLREVLATEPTTALFFKKNRVLLSALLL